MKEKGKSIVIENEIINKAITYIFEHIDDDITIDEIAQHCGYSKYHLMRLFKQDTEEALYQFIKRIRIERSAFRLKAEKNISITEIGADCGYSSSNFSTIFKKHLNQTPAGFRKQSNKNIDNLLNLGDSIINDTEKRSDLITIEYLNDIFVVFERRKGNYHNMDNEWCDFENKYAYLKTKDTIYLDCTIDDPSVTDENGCLYELCQSVSPNHPALKEHPEILTHKFEGGKHGVYHFKGYPQFLYRVYQEIFYRWLDQTGNHLDSKKPILDIYRKVENTGYMEIDICFPLKD